MNWKLLLPSGVTFVNFPEIYSNIQWHCSAASKITGAVTMALMVAMEARTCIEIGVANGFSTQCLARGLSAVGENGVLISCDETELSVALAGNMVHGLPVQHKSIHGLSGDVNWEDYLDGRLCDVAFIDGDHRYEGASIDLLKCSEVMSERGIMICHDYAVGQPGVIQAVNEFTEQTEWHKFTFPEMTANADYGWAILHR